MKRFLSALMLCCITFFVSADPIGPVQALKIASSYLKKDVSASHVKTLRRSTTRSAAESDTLAPLYFIDRGENAGFVIVSGDNCLPEIIGYTENGNYVEEDMPPAFMDMMKGFAQIIEEAQAAGAPARAQTRATTDRTAIQPLIQTHWHQSAPYNNLAPISTSTGGRAVTGCTCTAAVMVLHYFHRDLTDVLLAETPTYNEDDADAPVTVSYPKGTPIQWDLMLNQYTGSYPEEMGNAVAVLNAAFGAAIKQKYGAGATSGYIANIVNGYSTYFNVSSKCEYQNNISQDIWEQRIYDNLTNKQPMIYAGVHPDQGGHAIILDGYNPKSNLFHFNFGWGGSGDGYFTLDINTGIGGFSQQQGMVYDITPNKPNLTGKLYVDKQAAKRTETTIRVEVTNNGTLDYSGFNLYWGTGSRQPNSSTSVSESNTTLKLATGESGKFTASFKPSSEKTHYIYLTDKKYNILDKAEVEVFPTDTEITLESFKLEASGNTEEYKGHTFQLVYSDNNATATAILSNTEHGTPAQPGLRMNLFKYNKETYELEKVRTVNFENTPLLPGESKEVEASVNRITKDVYYALIINKELNYMDGDNELNLATADTIIRFKLCAPTLECTHAQNGVMVFKGDWNARTFSELATDATCTRYDLTQVTGINSQPIAANPNALFYTAVPVEGYNIVYQGHINELRLQQGYSFAPIANHTASVATFTPQWNIGQWNTLALPFTAIVPEGYICRKPTKFASTTIREATLTDTLLCGKPYLLMASREDPAPIMGTDITLCMEADTTGGEIFEAILTDTVAGNGILVLDLDPSEELQYFSLVDSGTPIAAFTGVLRHTSKRVRASVNSTSDQAYKTLADAIGTALLTYEEYHTAIKPEWNALLLDSIAAVQKIYTGMTLTLQNKIKETADNLLTYTELYKLQLIDESNAIDYTIHLVNPSFERGKKDGWTTTSAASIRTNSTLTTFAAGIDGTYFLYSESSSGTSIKQTVENLPRGYYRITALVGTNKEATLFANDSTTTVIPHEWGKFYLTENTVDSVWVEDGTLTVGVESATGWYKADNFRLYYLGSNGETGIDMPQTEVSPVIRQGIYDLLGRRVTDEKAMLPGHIYIVNGRKVIYKIQ